MELRANRGKEALEECVKALQVHVGTGRLWAVMIQLQRQAVHLQYARRKARRGDMMSGEGRGRGTDDIETTTDYDSTSSSNSTSSNPTQSSSSNAQSSPTSPSSSSSVPFNISRSRLQKLKRREYQRKEKIFLMALHEVCAQIILFYAT